MLKNKILLISLLPLILIGCKKEENTEPKVREKEEEPIVVVEPEFTINDVKEEDYKKIPTYIYSKLSEYSTYKLVTKGQTVSTSLIKVTQSIDVTSIKGEYSYMKNESHSNLVNTVHEAYYHNETAIYRDSESGDFTKSSLDDYLNIYGTYPFDSSIEGYSIKEENIKSVTKVSEQDEKHTFKVVFDEEKSTNNVKIQMKKFGGLDKYPSFSLVEMNLTIDADFTLRTIDLHTKYSAKKGLTTQCEQNYTVTFTNFNETIEIPNLESIKGQFN